MASPNHLVKSFVAYAALECLLTRMGQSVIFVVSPLMEPLSAELAYERLVPHMNSHVSVEGWTPVEGFPAGSALMGFLRSVDDFVTA